MKAQMRVGETWAEVNVGNISSTGLMIKCQAPPPVGSEIEIRRRGSVIKGRVAWVARSRCGVASHDPIEVAEFTDATALNVHVSRHAGSSRSKLWHWRHS